MGSPASSTPIFRPSRVRAIEAAGGAPEAGAFLRYRPVLPNIHANGGISAAICLKTIFSAPALTFVNQGRGDSGRIL